MGLHASRRIAAAFTLSAFAVSGCASRNELAAGGPPTIVSESNHRLVVETDSLDDGSVSLRVFRVSDRVLEPSLRREVVRRVTPADVPAIASSDVNWLALLDPRLVVAVVLGTYYVFVGVAEMLQDAVSEILRALRAIAPDRSPENATVRQKEIAHEPSPSIILVPERGPGAVLLGPQPTEGYRLDPALVQRLGGPGATVTAVDAEDDTLHSKFLIGAPR